MISNLRSGAAAENAVAVMQERGNPRRSRHRLTPGTVKFAAFHVLSLEGEKGLSIVDVAHKIQVVTCLFTFGNSIEDFYFDIEIFYFLEEFWSSGSNHK